MSIRIYCIIYLAYLTTASDVKESEPDLGSYVSEGNNLSLSLKFSNSSVQTVEDLELSQVNSSLVNNTETNATQKFANCIPANTTEVQLVNDTELIKFLIPQPNVTSRDMPAPCILVLFYSKDCPFSSMAAPHFNALPRAFPDIKMVAINAQMYHLFITQNGIVGLPSLLLFHNGRAFAKYNKSDYSLDLFSKFLTKYTGISPVEKSLVTSADFSGPVACGPSEDSDIFLIISWLFIIVCSAYYFTKSKWWTWIVDTVQSNWRDSAQHEHVE